MKKLLLSAFALSTVFGATAQEQRVALMELFSSSTCGPCRAPNAHMKTFLNNKNESEYVMVKYQQPFPGNGDPYTIPEGYARFNHYGGTGVPFMMVNGTSKIYAGGFNEAHYTAARSEAATYKLDGSYVIDNQTVTIFVNYTPLVANSGTTKLHVAIIETETSNNVKSNGETVFHNIVKRLVPNQNGTNISSTAVNTQESVQLEYEFKGSYKLAPDGQNLINDNTEHCVEDFANLRVVAWVQDGSNVVNQAAHLTLGTVSVDKVPTSVAKVNVYPNPTTDKFTVGFEMTKADEINASIVSINGQIVKNKTVKMNQGKNEISFETSDLAAGTYNLIIFDSKNNSHAQQIVVAH